MDAARPERRTLKVVCPHDCPDTCVMTVDVEDGKAVSIGGDPDHAFTQGFLCAKVNPYLERVYSPDRILHPLRRVGRKGEGRFERISWDAALGEIAARFEAIIAEHGSQAILPYSYAGNMGAKALVATTTPSPSSINAASDKPLSMIAQR
jgi:anaerobic selenocysteine-containing dehydrogenase